MNEQYVTQFLEKAETLTTFTNGPKMHRLSHTSPLNRRMNIYSAQTIFPYNNQVTYMYIGPVFRLSTSNGSTDFKKLDIVGKVILMPSPTSKTINNGGVVFRYDDIHLFSP